jgi:hypothetical protein
MKFNLWLLCCVLMVNPVAAMADDIYLEGISSVGEQRVAYIFVNKAKFSLKEGENFTRWKVTRIGQRSIFLSDIKGKETELVLHNRLPPESLDGIIPVAAMSAENSAPANSSTTPSQSDSQPENKSDKNPPVEEVPPGYRKVQTPFGEVVVKDDKPTLVVPPTPREVTAEPTPPVEKTPVEQTPSIPPQDSKPVAADDGAKKDEKEAEVRPGYHKVRTPFGDIWIEDKVTQEKTEAATETLPLTKTK